MNRLSELIEELCPNGVEYKKISEIYTRLKGTPITATKMKEIENIDGEIKIFAGGKTVINANEEDIPNANITRVPAVLVQSRGIINAIFYDKPFTFKNEMWAYTHNEVVSVKYLYYVLKNNVEYFRESASGMGALPQISLKVTENFKIPIPPLEVQCEIVRILDNFTKYKAELITELKARQKQYEYYRDYLLNFDDIRKLKKVKFVPLAEIADIRTGSHNTNEELEFGEYPFFVRSQEVRRLNTYDFDETAVITSGDGVGVGKIYHFVTGKYALHQRAYRIHINNEAVIPKYFYYYMKSMFLRYIEKTAVNSSVTSIRRKMLDDFPVPVPEKKIQEKIIYVLDNFETICNNLNIGLPKEIELRQKQYEYYRDKLLTF